MHVGYCKLQDASGGRALAAVACKAGNLQKLDLVGNRDLGTAGIRALAEALPADMTLTWLSLGDCGLQGAEGGDVVGAIASKSQCLNHLYLQKNPGLGNVGVE